jgi:hypothetical protein
MVSQLRAMIDVKRKENCENGTAAFISQSVESCRARRDLCISHVLSARHSDHECAGGWPNLKYDTGLGGYRIGVAEDQLTGAPKYGRSQEWDWANQENDRRV